MHSFVMMLVPADVEDVAQEVFIRLYFSLEQLRTAEVFEPWRRISSAVSGQRSSG